MLQQETMANTCMDSKDYIHLYSLYVINENNTQSTTVTEFSFPLFYTWIPFLYSRHPLENVLHSCGLV